MDGAYARTRAAFQNGSHRPDESTPFFFTLCGAVRRTCWGCRCRSFSTCTDRRRAHGGDEEESAGWSASAPILPRTPRCPASLVPRAERLIRGRRFSCSLLAYQGWGPSPCMTSRSTVCRPSGRCCRRARCGAYSPPDVDSKTRCLREAGTSRHLASLQRIHGIYKRKSRIRKGEKGQVLIVTYDRTSLLASDLHLTSTGRLLEQAHPMNPSLTPPHASHQSKPVVCGASTSNTGFSAGADQMHSQQVKPISLPHVSLHQSAPHQVPSAVRDKQDREDPALLPL